MSQLTDFLTMVSALDTFYVLDTETTGLRNAEIVQIAIINNHSEVLLDTLVKPVASIPNDAYRIHGINDEMVKEAPVWDDVAVLVGSIYSGLPVLIYNSPYDVNAMQYSSSLYRPYEELWNTASDYIDVMGPFAEMYGAWNEYHQSYTWQKLETAAQFLDVPFSDAHTALGDCKMTLAVTLEMIRRHNERQQQASASQ